MTDDTEEIPMATEPAAPLMTLAFGARILTASEQDLVLAVARTVYHEAYSRGWSAATLKVGLLARSVVQDAVREIAASSAPATFALFSQPTTTTKTIERDGAGQIVTIRETVE